MQKDQANALIGRIFRHWDMEPTRERLRGWHELFYDTENALGLDAGRAGTAFIRLKPETKMTPAIFYAEYRLVEPETPHTIPGNYRGISFAQHIEGLRRKANWGDKDAIAEIARWNAIADKQRTTQLESEVGPRTTKLRACIALPEAWIDALNKDRLAGFAPSEEL